MQGQPVKFPSVLGFGGVLSVQEDYASGSRRGSWACDETRINRTYSTRIKVQTLASTTGPLGIINSLGVKVGDTYRFPLYAAGATEIDTGSFVQSIEVEQESEDSKQWSVTIEYGPFDVPSILGTSYASQGIIDPTARAWEAYWDAAKYRHSKPTDESDPPKPYINTAGSALLDPPETEETRPVLKITHVEPIYRDDFAANFKDTVNGDEFLGYPPNVVKCRDIKGEWHWDSDWGIVWLITYEFEFRDDEDGFGYDQRVVNQGYQYKLAGGGSPINAVDGQGQPVTDAVLLQLNGDKLPTGADPVMLTFKEFPTANFSLLNIPDDILVRTTM